MVPGKVYLVGAGPGDPGLLTVRGRQCLELADAVIYDALVNPALLDYAAAAEQIYVGKKSDRHSLPQEEIQRLMVEYASRGLTVVRLKGGDPFVFGRGGEEAMALAAAGIVVEVVPGITAGIAAAAYAGIPVTHRGLATSVTFVTGHLSGEHRQLDLDFGRFDPGGTLIFYMGVAALPRIRDGLLANGWRRDTPCAVVEWGTYARQRTVTGALDSIAGSVEAEGIGAPAIIIVGAVAGLRESLAWFESRPLFGLRVAVTHAEERKGALESRLLGLGADVMSFPTVEVTPEQAPDTLGDAGAFDWIVLTSANAAAMLFAHLDAAGRDARALGGVKLCAVGTATLEVLADGHLRPDALPENYTSEAIVAAMASLAPLDGAKVLLPRADIARESLARALEEVGARVTQAVAYHTQPPTLERGVVDRLLAYRPQLVVFTNAAAVRNLTQLLSREDLSDLQGMAQAASIGPVTTKALRAAGFEIAVEPHRHDVSHLAEAVCVWWRAGGM